MGLRVLFGELPTVLEVERIGFDLSFVEETTVWRDGEIVGFDRSAKMNLRESIW